MVALYSFVYLPPVVLFPYALTVWIQVDELLRMRRQSPPATVNSSGVSSRELPVSCSYLLIESSVLSRVDEAFHHVTTRGLGSRP